MICLLVLCSEMTFRKVEMGTTLFINLLEKVNSTATMEMTCSQHQQGKTSWKAEMDLIYFCLDNHPYSILATRKLPTLAMVDKILFIFPKKWKT